MRIDPADVALCVSDPPPRDASGPTPAAPPIAQTSLFSFPSFQSLVERLGAEHLHHVYTRGQNPTVEAVESKLAQLERGEACKCFASGMAAVSGVLLGLLKAGDHVLFVNHVYGPTIQLAEHLARFGIRHDVLLEVSPESVRGAMRPETRLVWLESPGTMLFRVLDIAAIAEVARSRGALTCVDNSWATPLLQKPLTLGADIVVHSATKYLAGHSDVVAGAVVSAEETMREIFYRAFMLNGGVLGPMDAWLLLRGMRTLPVRMRQHEADALAIAGMLAEHPKVRGVFHPAFSADAEVVGRQLAGFSGLLSFELARGDAVSVARVIDRLRHFRIGVSWGGVESLVLSPNRGTNAAQLEAQGIPPGLIRISVGLEGAELLMDDLQAALEAA